MKTFLAIMSLPAGFSILSRLWIDFLRGTSFKYSIWFSVIDAISFLGYPFLWFWAMLSLLYNLKENTGIKESYINGFKILGAFIWVWILFSTITAGGFLLVIIPGVLFFVWFSLAIFVLVFEQKKGFQALWRSKHLVKGKFWGVLGRFLTAGFIAGIGAFLSPALIFWGIETKLIGYEIGFLISIILGSICEMFVLPFLLFYGFFIYNNLKELKAEIPYEEPTLKGKVPYAIPALLGILVFGFLFSHFLYSIFQGRDIPPIEDKDLWLSKIEIPMEENAFYLLTKAGKEIDLPREKLKLFSKMVEGEEWDSEFAEELIIKNKEAFDDFEKALELPYFQLPELQDPKTIWVGMDLPSMLGIQKIGQLNSIRAYFLFLQGREREALDGILKTIQMGQMIMDSPRPVLISYLAGRSVKEVGLWRLRRMIPKLTLPSKVLKDYVAKLEPYKANEEGLIQALKMEYIWATQLKVKYDAAYAGKLSEEDLKKLGMNGLSSFPQPIRRRNDFFYKPNQTQRMLAELYRDAIRNAAKNYYNEMKLLESQPLSPSSGIKVLFQDNLIGKILYDLARPNFRSIFKVKCFEDFYVVGTQTLMAMRAYQLRTHKIPRNLDELVPEYLSGIPADPFDGKPIRYLREKKRIYSVGEDLKDSGGSEGKPLREMEDPTFKIEF